MHLEMCWYCLCHDLVAFTSIEEEATRCKNRVEMASESEERGQKGDVRCGLAVRVNQELGKLNGGVEKEVG